MDPKKTKEIEAAVQSLMCALGADLNAPGLVETPARAARMFSEMFEGMRYSNDEIAAMFNKSFQYSHAKDLVLLKDIRIFSFCEHHFALMYNMVVHVGYIPAGKVLGLSKIARIVDMVGKRFQLQERIGSDVAYIMQKALGTKDVMVVIEGEHSCMNARGIRAHEAKTRTNTYRGAFDTDFALRNEVLLQL